MLSPRLHSEKVAIGGSNSEVYGFQVSGSWDGRSWNLIWNFILWQKSRSCAEVRRSADARCCNRPRRRSRPRNRKGGNGVEDDDEHEYEYEPNNELNQHFAALLWTSKVSFFDQTGRSRPAAGLKPDTRNLPPKKRNKIGIEVKDPYRRIFSTIAQPQRYLPYQLIIFPFLDDRFQYFATGLPPHITKEFNRVQKSIF